MRNMVTDDPRLMMKRAAVEFKVARSSRFPEWFSVFYLCLLPSAFLQFNLVNIQNYKSSRGVYFDIIKFLRNLRKWKKWKNGWNLRRNIVIFAKLSVWKKMKKWKMQKKIFANFRPAILMCRKKMKFEKRKIYFFQISSHLVLLVEIPIRRKMCFAGFCAFLRC